MAHYALKEEQEPKINMAFFPLDSVKRYTEADNTFSSNDKELLQDHKSYVDNSKKQFVWNQIAKYAGLALTGLVMGVSGALAATMFGAEGLTSMVTPAVGGTLLGAAAVVGIGAAYISHQISINNSFNITEVNARQTSKLLAEELTKKMDSPEKSLPQTVTLPEHHLGAQGAAVNMTSHAASGPTDTLLKEMEARHTMIPQTRIDSLSTEQLAQIEATPLSQEIH